MRVDEWTLSPEKKRSSACCEAPDSRLSNFFEKRLALRIDAASAGCVFTVYVDDI